MPDKITQTTSECKSKLQCFVCKGSGLTKVETVYCNCYTPEDYGCYVCQGKGFTQTGYDTCQTCWGSGLYELKES